jgi:HEPN domain-containing protein
MWLFHRAMEFEQAYHAVPEMPPLSWPRYFLLCHSIELALKAFLTLHGESESDLKLIGHDLKKLLKHAERRGLKLEPDTQRAVKRLARAHYEHWARYPKKDIRRVYAIEQFEKNATELLQQVRVAIYPPPPTN